MEIFEWKRPNSLKVHCFEAVSFLLAQELAFLIMALPLDLNQL